VRVRVMGGRGLACRGRRRGQVTSIAREADEGSAGDFKPKNRASSVSQVQVDAMSHSEDLFPAFVLTDPPARLTTDHEADLDA